MKADKKLTFIMNKAAESHLAGGVGRQGIKARQPSCGKRQILRASQHHWAEDLRATEILNCLGADFNKEVRVTDEGPERPLVR